MKSYGKLAVDAYFANPEADSNARWDAVATAVIREYCTRNNLPVPSASALPGDVPPPPPPPTK